jgi:ribonuclease HIII
MKKTSYTVKLTPQQQQALENLLRSGNYRPLSVPHTTIAVEAQDCRVNVYKSGKCLIQGKGTEDFITFVLEPSVLLEAKLGYEEVLDPKMKQPHMGIDESGKGDFFGPMVIAAAYIDKALYPKLQELGVRDSKTISSDKKALAMARSIRDILGDRFSIVTIGNEAYNRLYTKMRNVNTLLAWGHARAIENLLEKTPDCPRALSDQFGPKRMIQQSLMKKGRSITLEQMPRAEADPAVAAASILARAGFLQALERIGKACGLTIPKGASAQVREMAEQLVRQKGPEILVQCTKCHFRTTDKVLESTGHTRQELGEYGQAVSRPVARK